jgi:hypothetical protein
MGCARMAIQVHCRWLRLKGRQRMGREACIVLKLVRRDAGKRRVGRSVRAHRIRVIVRAVHDHANESRDESMCEVEVTKSFEPRWIASRDQLLGTNSRVDCCCTVPLL